MDIYNMSHFRDMTAAIAISRADRARRRLKKEPIRRLAGLTYKIGEIVQLTWEAIYTTTATVWTPRLRKR